MNTLLQIAGFGAAVIFLFIYYALSGERSAFPALILGAFTVHFAGDWMASFLKPLTIAGFSLKEAVFPKKFTLFVGLMLALASFFFLLTDHHTWGAILGFFGLALALTGFVWDLIYP